MNTHSNSILILDDDPNFRSHIAALMNSRGLNVVEARSGREANEILSTVRPVLAIVDYRLPEQDGISWITKVREDGRTFPIVFLSSTWCDEKTFSRLRNLLRVSLILQKPIVADLFLQQIENLLPAHLFSGSSSAPAQVTKPYSSIEITRDASGKIVLSSAPVGADETAKPEQEMHTAEAPGEPSAAEAPGDSPSIQTESQTLAIYNPFTKLKSKLERQQRVEDVKAAYRDELHKHWSQLMDAVTRAKENLADGVSLAEASNTAHKLRGTAGSVGFQSIGEIAGKVEDMLHHLDPTDPMQEVIWPEIFRLLVEGETQVRMLQGEEQTNQANRARMPRKKILVWGSAEKLEALSENDDVHIDFREALPDVLESLKGSNYSAVFIDLGLGTPGEMFMGAKEIRMMHPNANACVPLGCLLPPYAVPPEELVFAGFSVVLQHDASAPELLWAYKRLSSIRQVTSHRILTVDDDDVLTTFISSILTSEGMTVHALNQPIKILDALEDFKPELILLDVMMPGLSGYDVCRMLRNDPNWKHVPIVFLTSKSDQAGRAAAFQAGGDDFLSKPILAEELSTRVRAQLDRVKREEGDVAEVAGTLRGRDFMKEANIALARVQKEETRFSLGLLAIDKFSEILIEHGMETAALSIATLTALCTEHFGADVLRGRVGEEGLALLFPEGEKNTVELALAKLLQEFQAVPLLSEVAKRNITCSFNAGVAQYPDDGTIVHKLLSTANQKMLTNRMSATKVNSSARS